ncbi:MAG: hypothetical protein EPO00_10010, partial [Chloroflexota bacterium]
MSARSASRFRALLAIAERLATSFDRSDLYRIVVDAAHELTAADYAILRIEQGGALDIVASAGLPVGLAGRLPPIVTPDPAVDQVLASGQ